MKQTGKEYGKNHVKEIINTVGNLDQPVQANMVERPIENVTREEMVIAIRATKPGRAVGPSKVGWQ